MSQQLTQKIQQNFHSLEEYIDYSENVLKDIIREAERVRSYGQEIPEYYYQSIERIRGLVHQSKTTLSRCH